MITYFKQPFELGRIEISEERNENGRSNSLIYKDSSVLLILLRSLDSLKLIKIEEQVNISMSELKNFGRSECGQKMWFLETAQHHVATYRLI